MSDQLVLSPRARHRLDRLVRSIARGAMWGWFRRRETVGAERLEGGPVVVVANHSNGFVDPALLVAESPRPLRFLAKATLWRRAPVGWLLDLAGALPVHRAEDRPRSPGGSDNASVFAASHAELARDGAIAVFPEGTVNDTLVLSRLHTGAARIAIGAAADGTTGVRIVPVGLLYDDKAAPRSRALLRVGRPVEVGPWLAQRLGTAQARLGEPGVVDPDDRALADALTDAVRDALADAWADQSDRFEYAALLQACEVVLRTSASPGTVPLSASEAMVRRVVRAPDEDRREVTEALGRYRLLLGLAGVDDSQVVAGSSSGTRARSARRVATLVVLAPPAAVGAVVNAPAWQLVLLAGRRPMARVSRANFTLLTSLVALPAGWVALALVLRRLRLPHPWIVALVGGPLTGQATVAWREQADRLRSSRAGWWRMLRDPEAAAALTEARGVVLDAVDAALVASVERERRA